MTGRADEPRRGVVLSGTGGIWRIHTEDGEEVDASMRGRLKQEVEAPREPRSSARSPRLAPRLSTALGAGSRPALKLAVGDQVRVERDERARTWAICDILPRRSRLARRAPGGAYGERVVAANVDQVVIVFAIARPEPHPRMLDRFLVIAEANDLAARILINKVDLAEGGEPAAHARFADYERAGYPVHYTSTKTGAGLEPVRAMLGGRVSVFTGPSGVGKSSLLNALFPGLNLRVGEISESVNKGRHTTVGARMAPLPHADGAEEGYVVDTPGLREVGMWALAPERLDACFPELRPHLAGCRFADCTHTVEPGCAVRDAVERGDVSRPRYESYVKLRGEMEEADFTY